MRTSSSGSEREESDFDDTVSGSEREESDFDDTSSGSDREVVDDDTDHEEKVSGEPSVGATGRKKIHVPVEIMNIVKRYTEWQTIEELDTAETKCCRMSSDSDYGDLNIELKKMQDLSSELEAYHFLHASNHNTLDAAVEKALLDVVKQYPSIRKTKEFKQLSEVNKYRIRATLYYKRRDGEVDLVPQGTTDAGSCPPGHADAGKCLRGPADDERSLKQLLDTPGQSDAGKCLRGPADAERSLKQLLDTPGQSDAGKCLRGPADAERSLEQLLDTLVEDMEKVRAESKLCVAAAEVSSRVRDFIDTLKATIDRCRWFVYKGRRRMGVELVGQAKECQKSVEDDENEGRDCKRVKLAGPAKEGQEGVEEDKSRKLTKEKFQYLCKVMKNVLGSKVDDVVVSDCSLSSSHCLLRDSSGEDVVVSDCLASSSCTGGMTMEINPEDHLIKDLQKRVCSSANDLLVRSVALLLFDTANAQRQVRIRMTQLERYGVSQNIGFAECACMLRNIEHILAVVQDLFGIVVLKDQDQEAVQRLCAEKLASVHEKLMAAVDHGQCCVNELKMCKDQYLRLSETMQQTS